MWNPKSPFRYREELLLEAVPDRALVHLQQRTVEAVTGTLSHSEQGFLRLFPAGEAELVARVLCCVVTIVDPALVVLGGGVGQAPGFAAAVTRELERIAPVMPEVRVSALGSDVVVHGCLAAGAELAWKQLTATLPVALSPDGGVPAQAMNS